MNIGWAVMSKVFFFILTLTIPQVMIFYQENTFSYLVLHRKLALDQLDMSKKVILLISVDNLFLVKPVVFSTIDNVVRGSYRGDLWKGSRTEKIEDHVSRI